MLFAAGGARRATHRRQAYHRAPACGRTGSRSGAGRMARSAARRGRPGRAAADPSGAPAASTNRTGTTIPFSQWPGMWQPDEPAARRRRRVGGHGPDDVDALPGPGDDAGRRPSPRARRRWASGPGGGSACGGLGGLPRDLVREVADDRLVDHEAAVDHVEHDGLARHEVDDRRDVRVVARDDVDLARVRARAGRDRRGRGGRAGVAGGEATAASDRERQAVAARAVRPGTPGRRRGCIGP